jgi:predicted nucleic acid-binding Zn ribbon protein
MPTYLYKCDDCDLRFEERFYHDKGKILLSDSDEEVNDEIYDSYVCPKCHAKAKRLLFQEGQDLPGWVKGNCFTNRERERKFYEKGLDEQQARRFYKESLEASKERINTMGEVYKEVAPDMTEMVKNGAVKKVAPKEADKRKKAFTKVVKEITRKDK